MKFYDKNFEDFYKTITIVIGERGAGRLHWEKTHPELMKRLKKGENK